MSTSFYPLKAFSQRSRLVAFLEDGQTLNPWQSGKWILLPLPLLQGLQNLYGSHIVRKRQFFLIVAEYVCTESLNFYWSTYLSVYEYKIKLTVLLFAMAKLPVTCVLKYTTFLRNDFPLFQIANECNLDSSNLFVIGIIHKVLSSSCAV